jgi:UDP-N-acetylglucosamine diphosphorylase/glucosamine-1-phosphate N-acetyltransferase
LDIILFDDPILADNLKPLTYTRAIFDLTLGPASILDRLLNTLKPEHVTLVVPNYLKEIVEERHPNFTVNPQTVNEDALFVNGFFNPNFKDFLRKADSESKRFVIFDKDVLVAAKLSTPSLSKMVQAIEERKPYPKTFAEGSTILEASELVIARYPWHLLDLIGGVLREQIEKAGEGKAGTLPNILLRGNSADLRLGEEVTVEGFVTFDTSSGPIILDDECVIESFARISGPSYIGRRSLIRSSSIIEGSIIGEVCKIGGEVSNSIILGYTNKAHLGYIGHSLVGEWVNFGAGTCNSDLKNTYGNVRVKVGDLTIDTKRAKVGCFVGDGVKSSIGTQIGTGRKIGVYSHIGGFVDEDIRPFTFCPKGARRGAEPMQVEEAVKVQRRMMERRGKRPTEAYVNMMKLIFERYAYRVSKYETD